MLRRAPSWTFSDITTFSRSESIGGLVTSAKRCLKYANNGRGLHGRGRVVAHRADRLDAVVNHRSQHHDKLFARCNRMRPDA